MAPIAPPRRLSAGALLNLFLGSTWSQAGWALAGLGLFLFWLSAYDVLRARELFDRPLTDAQAVVQGSEVTYARVNKIPVIAHRYVFLHEGREVPGVSYSTGESLARGLEVPIEYAPEEPEISRLKLEGFRAAPHEEWIVWVVLALPAAGASLMLGDALRSLRRLRLLRRGLLAPASVVDRQATGAVERIDGQALPIYRLTLAYVVDGRTHQARYETYRPELLGPREPQVLYLADRPARALALDELAENLALDEQGALRARRPPWHFLLVPGSFLLLNLVTLSLKLYSG